jgi:hypothetical protein
MTNGMFRSVLGQPLDAIIARLEVLATRVTDGQGTGAVHMIRARKAFNAGRYAEAYAEAVQGSGIPGAAGMFLGVALNAAAWGGLLTESRDLVVRADRDLGARTLDLEEMLAAHAGLDILEGRIDAGAAAYRRAIAMARDAGALLLVAEFSLNLVVLIGADHPAAREAIAEARSIYESLGASFWVDRALEVAASYHAVGRVAL